MRYFTRIMVVMGAIAAMTGHAYAGKAAACTQSWRCAVCGICSSYQPHAPRKLPEPALPVTQVPARTHDAQQYYQNLSAARSSLLAILEARIAQLKDVQNEQVHDKNRSSSEGMASKE